MARRKMTRVASMQGSTDEALRAMQEDNSAEDAEARRIRGDIYKMLDQGTASITDLWAPPRMKILYDNIEMGEESLAVYTISNWPTELQYGWFNNLIDDDSLSDIKMDVSMHIHPIRKEFATTYLQDKFAAAASDAAAEQERGKVKQANQEIYQRQQDTAQLMMNMLKNGNENMFQVSLVIGIYGQNKWAVDEDGNEYLEKDAHQDLVEKTNRFKKVLSKNSQGGFGLKPLLHQQRDGIKSLMPMGYGGLHAFQNFYTSALATAYPFTQGNMQVDNGVLFGLQLPSSQPVFFNPFDRKWLHSYNLLCIGAMGSGKQLQLTSTVNRVILTKTDENVIKNSEKCKIADLRVNDNIINGDGTPCKVTNIYNQGTRSDNYRFMFEDGREIVSGAEHLWDVVVQTHGGRKKDVVMSSKEMYEKLRPHRKGTCYQYHIRNNGVINYSEKDLPLDPWFVGFMIGDGCLAGKQCDFSTGDAEIVDRIRTLFEPYGYRIYKQMPDNPADYTWCIRFNGANKADDSFNLKQRLKDIDLLGHTSYTKRIPVDYLQSSIEQRRELLAGLMDSDGTAHNGRYSYSTVNDGLKDDFMELTRSLGYTTTLRIDNRPWKYTQSDVAYSIGILTHDDICWLERKRKDKQDFLNSRSKRDTCARKDPKVYDDAEDISSLPLSPWLVGFMLARGKCQKSKRSRPRTGDTVIDRKTYVSLSDDEIMTFSDHMPDSLSLVEAKSFKETGDGRKQYIIGIPGVRLGRNIVSSDDAFCDAIEEAGLFDKGVNRSISDRYLHASVEVREQLLSGLIAARGYEGGGSNGTDTQINVAEPVGHSVIELVEELGYAYTSSVTKVRGGKNRMEISIKCERDGYRRMDIESQMVAITDIVPDDTPREMACIAVDSPDKTFLVDDFIRTHNSAYAKTLLGRLALQGTQLFIIDPANNAGGEYTNLATSLDGTIIDFGGKDGIYLNPFELSVPSTWHKGSATDSRQASSIFKAKKEYLGNLIDIMADQFMEGSDAAYVFGAARAKIPFVLDALLNAVYITHGISIGGKRFKFDQWVQTDKMPTLTDFYNLVSEYDKNLGLYQTRDQIMAWGQQNLRDGTLINKSSKTDKIMFAYYNYIIRSNNEVWKKEEHEAVHLLRNILEPFMAGEEGEEMSPKAALFHGERRADLTNQCVVFRFGGKDSNEQIKELAIFMCFELINQRVTAVTTNTVYKNKIVVMDEAWKLIKTKSARSYVEKFCREGRKANTGIWLLSQSYMDFQGDNAVFADLSEMQIILSVPENEVSLLIEDLGLSSSIADMINSDKSKHTPGTGVLAIKGRIKKKIPIYNYMSPLEAQIADTADATKPPMMISDFIPADEMEKLGIKDEDAAGYGAVYRDDM